MLYDLTTLQREANTRFGFSAKRTLAAAQRLLRGAQGAHLPAHELALPDERHGRRDQADRRARRRTARVRRTAAEYVTGLDLLPLARVVNDAKVTDHHAIIPTRSEHPVEKMGSDDRRIYDMVARRFLAVFHPEAVFENTRVETTVAVAGRDYVFRTQGRVLLVPGWRGVYDEVATMSAPSRRPRRRGRARSTSSCRGSCDGEQVETRADRERAQGNQAAAALQRRVAAGRDGDGRQARRRRRAARGDEGLRDRHAGDARGDHRAADPGRLRRARRARAGRDREGPERHPAARTSTRSPRPG